MMTFDFKMMIRKYLLSVYYGQYIRLGIVRHKDESTKKTEKHALGASFALFPRGFRGIMSWNNGCHYK